MLFRSESGRPISLVSPDSPTQWFDLDRGALSIGKEEKRRQLEEEHERIRREMEELDA